MAEQKAVPDQPKDNTVNKPSTVYTPKADSPPLDDKGNPLPYGPETLEKQRTDAASAEQTVSQSDNPLEPTGVEADISSAKSAPTFSGQPDAKAVEDRGDEVKDAMEEQAEDLKSEVAPAVPGKPMPVAPTVPVVPPSSVAPKVVTPVKSDMPPLGTFDTKNPVNKPRGRGRPRKV